MAVNALSAQPTDTLVGTTVLSSIGADAELIATCAAFCELERAYDVVAHEFEAGSAEEEAAELERTRIVAGEDALVARMCTLPCTSLAGVQAMAKALTAWDRELLRDTPASDTGDVIASNLVQRLLALRAPVHHPDADLLAVCADFRASDAALNAIYDERSDHATDEECDALAAPICNSWDGMLDRLAELRATTSEGLAARALALAEHSGIKPGCRSYAFDFNPNNQKSITGRLLHMLLVDAVRLCGAPARDPDAELLAMRPEFDRLHASMVAYNKDLIPDGAECADFDALCGRIATAPPAATAAGRAFQAAAAMHHLTYRMSEGENVTDPTWLMLKGVAGSAFQSVEARP